jgi:hypothetical protein
MMPDESAPPRGVQPLRGDTARAFERAVEHFGKRLRLAARKIAHGERDVAEDLYAAAIAQLWELDPSRFDEDDEAYLWTSMIYRMLTARSERAGDPMRPPLALRFR